MAAQAVSTFELSSLLTIEDRNPKDYDTGSSPNSIDQKLANILKMPELQRARVAQFCYTKVHMRELGLRIAQSCGMRSLQIVFGAGAETIFNQSRNVEATLGALKIRNGGHDGQKISLSLVKTD